MSLLRNKKQTYVLLVASYKKQGKLTAAEAEGFEGMFRRCRSSEEQTQVFTALMANIGRLSTDNDVYARLHRDDLLEQD